MEETECWGMGVGWLDQTALLRGIFYLCKSAFICGWFVSRTRCRLVVNL
jgi:hypothetical protein